MIDHLKSRHFYNFERTLHIDNDVVVFPIWNLSGQLIGYQNYRPDKPKDHYSPNNLEIKYFTKMGRIDGKTHIGVWGLETYSPHKRLFLTEGIFDACRLHNFGESAIACLGSNPKNIKNWLSILPNFTVAICDGDSAGNRLTVYTKAYYTCPTDLDLGDFNDIQIQEILDNLKEKPCNDE